MQDKNIERAYVCDSDILIYSNLTEVFDNNYINIDFGCMCISENICHNAAVSFWNMTTLNKFCSCIRKIYTESKSLEKINLKWDKILQSGKPGSFSDMDAVEIFAINNSNNLKFVNLCIPANSAVFDNNINYSTCLNPNEYDYKYFRKNINWKNKLPYCFNLITKENIKFNTLHMQGPAKYLVSKFYKGKKFKGKLKLDIKFFILNKLSYIYKLLKIREKLIYLKNTFKKN